MLSNSAHDQEPRPQLSVTPRVMHRAKLCFFATRPMFLTASILPVLLGSVWGWKIAGGFDGAAFVLALLSTALVHAGANVLNDVYDDAIGSDRLNTGRIYPYTGGSRFIQNRVLSAQEMRTLGIGLLMAGFAIGLPLIALKGVAVLGFGLIGLLLAVAYSKPPLRLSDRGMGEIAVGIAFGVLPVCGSAWLQAGAVDLNTFLLSLPVSCWVTNILLINEIPDAEADAIAGRRNWVVRFGTGTAGAVFLVLNGSAAAAALWLAVFGPVSGLIAVGPLLLLGLAWKASRLLAGPTADRLSAIKSTLAIHAIGSLWLIGVVLLSGQGL